ncbi:MAG TPA: guanylate kinase [Pseudomonadales bacterium]|nr:guanylate kinase [Pseudomonadales bacterium]
MSADAQPGLLLVVSAPSGAGKTSLVNALVSHDANIVVSVSHTTRARRGKEREGVEYFFVDPPTFASMRDAGAFLEQATVFGNSYGTSRAMVERELAAGRDVLLEIDWQGAQQIRRSFAQAITLFVLPPSHATLDQRLRGRAQDDEAAIRKRTAEAVIEMSHYAEYDYLIVNDRFDDAVADLQAIIRAERLRGVRQARRRAALLADLLSHAKPIQ